MKRTARIFAFMLALGMTVLAAGCGAKAPGAVTAEPISFVFDQSPVKPKPMLPEDTANLAVYQKVADNGTLELYLDQTTSYFACFDKRTGKTWYSVPPGIVSDPAANDESRPLSQSTITVEYYQNFNPHTIDNYTYSIQDQEFSIEQNGNGFVVTYNMELERSALTDIPQKIKDNRFRKFFINNQNLTENDKIRIERYYVFDEAQDCWVYSDTEDRVPNMIKIMERVGYTTEELAKDNAAFGIKENPNRVFFKIPLEVLLDGDSMIVRIDGSKMEYNPNCPPTTIALLRSMGNATSDQSGYIMVPDGSGALASYDAKNTRPGIYKGRVYGIDLSIPQETKAENDYNLNLPVFGQKVKDDAFFAIIEEGDAQASINVVRAGQLNSYNSVYPDFVIADVQQTTVGGGTSTQSMAVVSPNPYRGDLRVRYAFLNSESADYSGMARYYHRYLKQANKLEKTASEVSLNLNLLGAIHKEQSILGIEYTGMEPLTTFEQAQSILEQLGQQGVSKLNIKYSGWFNHGLMQFVPEKFDVISSLGGKSGLKNFNQFAKQKGVNVFYDVSMVEILGYSDSFNSYQDAAKALDNGFSRLYEYSLIDGTWDHYNYIASLEYLDSLTGEVLKNSEKLGIDHISFADLADSLYTDFGCEGFETRQDAKNVYLHQLDRFNEKLPGGIKDNANGYAIFPGDVVTNAPLESNNMKVFDQTIPFYGMVFHGLTEYTGEPINYATDTRYQVLKHIENGASPYFSVMYADSSVVKNSEFTYLYANNYDLWKDRIVSIYQEISAVLDQVKGEQIVKHQQKAPGVVAVEYANGKIITVDYNQMSHQITDKGQ